MVVEVFEKKCERHVDDWYPQIDLVFKNGDAVTEDDALENPSFKVRHYKVQQLRRAIDVGSPFERILERNVVFLDDNELFPLFDPMPVGEYVTKSIHESQLRHAVDTETARCYAIMFDVMHIGFWKRLFMWKKLRDNLKDMMVVHQRRGL